MIHKLNQSDTTSAVDTLTKSYDQKWEAAEHLDQAGTFIQFMASYDLILVVLAVSLVIWLILLIFIIRLDRKVSDLEKKVEDKQ